MAVYETYSDDVVTAEKPFGNTLIELAEKRSDIIGLGDAVASVICEADLSVKFKKIGVPDGWMECRSVPYLTDKYGLSAQHIAQAVREIIAL